MSRRATSVGGFTYVEVLLAVVILAGAVASMGLVLEQSRTIGTDAPRIATADYLLRDGFAWVRMLARSDPTSPGTFGLEAGEVAPDGIDDVDDLDGLIETQVVDRSGEMFGAEWSRKFAVSSVDLTDPRVTVAAGSTALLRVTIAVRLRGIDVAEDYALLWRPQ
ncbi:MAG: hypothetical protein IPM29_03310 [Planctomycetes bacterium]|nr:hypothetical protein [Planctomycetota bacterium]